MHIKFEMLTNIIQGKLDILLVSETKIDISFPSGQFIIPRFVPPYRFDRNNKGGDLLLYLREDIASKIIFVFKLPIDCFLIEVNLCRTKWFLGCFYNPHKTYISDFLKEISKVLDLTTANYEHLFFMGDLNSEVKEKCFREFCHLYNLKNLINMPTCFKNPSNPSCIDLMLANHPRSFQNLLAIDTGLSDFHRMTVTVMKAYSPKLRPKLVNCRDFKKFSNKAFRDELLNNLCHSAPNNDDFMKLGNRVLDRHNPQKKRYIRANQKPFITSELNKAIMNRSRLRNRYLKLRSSESEIAYTKQRNYTVNLLRKEKKIYYKNLDLNNIADNKQFWRNVEPLLSDKISESSKITLVNNNRIVSDDREICNIFNQFFVNVVPNLNIPEFTGSDNLHEHVIGDSVQSVLYKYRNHPSIIKIKERPESSEKFVFSFVSENEIGKLLRNLNARKSSPKSDILIKQIKDNLDIFSQVMTKYFNDTVNTSEFPAAMKFADVISVFKKNERSIKENYRPVSILPVFSKIFEKILHDQILAYFANILSKNQCGFRKCYSSQYRLVTMIEKWKKSLDSKGSFGALLTDLSKAFGCIPHELMIAKLDAYGFDLKVSILVFNYLSNRKQGVKISSSYSDWCDLLFGVPQGSILRPSLFIIFICYLFYFEENVDIASYVDGKTPYCASHDIQTTTNTLQDSSAKLFDWFSKNSMKANADKCHLLLSENIKHVACINHIQIENNTSRNYLE